MTSATLSSKFQIVIPREIREEMHFNAGMKLEMIPYGKTLLLVPVLPIEELRELFKGAKIEVEREKKDRLL